VGGGCCSCIRCKSGSGQFVKALCGRRGFIVVDRGDSHKEI